MNFLMCILEDMSMKKAADSRMLYGEWMPTYPCTRMSRWSMRRCRLGQLKLSEELIKKADAFVFIQIASAFLVVIYKSRRFTNQ